MQRVKIDFPETFVFSTEIPIYIQHINYGQHVDNAALLMLVSEARVRFFRHFGYSELDVEGAGIILADLAMQYRSESFHGETLVIQFAANGFLKSGFDLIWQISDKASNREVARGKHGVMFMDYKTRKLVAIPDAFLKKLDNAKI